MSSEKGNLSRSRPQKYKNRTSFRNNMHDQSIKTKMINSIQVGDVCVRCKDIIEWKIKYKKYKPLSQPKSCTKCSQRTVKKAYHVICKECVRALNVCAKCLESKEIVPAAPDPVEQLKVDAEIKIILKTLPERKRRTFVRYMNSKQAKELPVGEQKDDLMEKLAKLQLESRRKKDDDEDSFGSDFDEDDHDSDCNSDDDEDDNKDEERNGESECNEEKIKK